MRLPSNRRTVIVITTGGTIASVSDPAGVRRPVLGAQELLAAATTPAGGAVRVREELRLDSSQLTFAHLDQIRRAVSEELADPGVLGVVVTHGTDTMEETAMLLGLMPSRRGATADPRPVVLTGAALPASDPQADGPTNLRDALALAADPAAKGLGAVICFAGEVIAGYGAHKRHSDRLAVFGGEVIARITPDGKVRHSRDELSGVRRPRLMLPEHDLRGIRVDVVSLYPGADRAGLDAYARAGAHGLVLETMGNGGAPLGVPEAVAELVGAGVSVLACSRVAGAPVTPSYAGGSELLKAGAVLCAGLRAPQARVQLAALLASGADVEKVRAAFA